MLYLGPFERLTGYEEFVAAAAAVLRQALGSQIVSLPDACIGALTREGANLLAGFCLPQMVLRQKAGLSPVDTSATMTSSGLHLTPLQDWAEAISELLERLSHDRQLLAQQFGIPVDARLGHLSEPLGDLHHGRTVRIVTLSKGRVVYKPRSVNRESWWKDVAGFADLSELAEIFAAKAVCRKTYGWCELVEHGPVENAEGLGVFYQRSGGLAFWLWLTGARDAVASNIIAAGNRPFLIDCETLVYPVPQAGDRPGTLAETSYVPGRESQARCGLSSAGTQIHNVRCFAIETDGQIVLQRQGRVPEDTKNLPFLDGTPGGAGAYREFVIRGLRDACRKILARPEAVEQLVALVERTDELPGRFAFRPTRLYGEILASFAATGWNESWLTDTLEALPVPGGFSAQARAVLIEQERKALGRLTIPRFEFRVENKHVLEARTGTRLQGLVPGTVAASRRVRELSVQDMDSLGCEISESLNATPVAVHSH